MGRDRRRKLLKRNVGIRLAMMDMKMPEFAAKFGISRQAIYDKMKNLTSGGIRWLEVALVVPSHHLFIADPSDFAETRMPVAEDWLDEVAAIIMEGEPYPNYSELWSRIHE